MPNKEIYPVSFSKESADWLTDLLNIPVVKNEYATKVEKVAEILNNIALSGAIDGHIYVPASVVCNFSKCNYDDPNFSCITNDVEYTADGSRVIVKIIKHTGLKRYYKITMNVPPEAANWSDDDFYTWVLSPLLYKATEVIPTIKVTTVYDPCN